jgi:CRP/FNR family transcriptional regulator, cyclic AMP receptor protein
VATLTKIELLKRVPLFAKLSDTQAISLIGSLEKLRYKRSEHIIDIGEKSNALYVIISGRARVVIISDKGKEVVLATLGVGDCIGEMSLLDELPHSATVVADTQMDVLVLGRDAFSSCVMHNAPLAVSVMQGLVDRLRRANQKIASLAFVSVYGRVARALLASAEQDASGQLIISKKISHAAMSREIGASREMVSKALKEFEKQSFIRRLDDGSLCIVERRSMDRG